jgi:hypothetical protein
MAGRPSLFNEEIADRICEALISGQSLRSFCLQDDVPNVATVVRWLAKHDEFRAQYAHARELQADTIADEILDIADDGSNDWMERHDSEGGNLGWKENGEAIRRSQVRIDARKWLAGKLAAKKYGDKALIGSDPDNPLPNTPDMSGLSVAALKELAALATNK